MPSLVERARQLSSAEEDDFFLDETIVYYINKGQRKVVSYMINQERRLGKSLRALDNLRSVATVQPTAGTARNSYFKIDVDFPSGLNQYENLIYDGTTTLREITGNKLYMLEWGNLIPTSDESYFYVTNVSGTKTFRLYLFENTDGATDLEIYYISEPTDIVLADDTFTEIPDQLENAVLYSAVAMMSAQEQGKASELYTQMYQEELQANLF